MRQVQDNAQPARPTRGRPGGRRQERRRAVIEAAVQVFNDKGYHAATVADILERANVARGTFYRYFDSKQDCLGAVLDDFLAEIRGPIRELDISKPLSEAELIELYRNVVGLLIGDPRIRQFMNVLLREGASMDRVFWSRIYEFYEEIVEMTAGYLEAAIARGRVRQIDPRTTAWCILGMVKELLLYWARTGQRVDELPKMVDTALQFGLHGVLKDVPTR